MAIITRWRMPPENSCGYMSNRRAASGMPTSSSMAMPRRRASASPMPLCSRSTSVIWREIFRNGLSEVIGSWKIIARSVAADLVQAARPAG